MLLLPPGAVPCPVRREGGGWWDPGVQTKGAGTHSGLWFINKSKWIIYKTFHLSDHRPNGKHLLMLVGCRSLRQNLQVHGTWPLARKALPSRGEMVMKYSENTSKNNLTAII